MKIDILRTRLSKADIAELGQGYVRDDGKAIGIVSSRSAVDPELEEFAFEATHRKRFS